MSAYERAGESDEWYPPRYIFDAIGLRFALAVAAPILGPRHVPTQNWYHSLYNGLRQPWASPSLCTLC